MLSPKSFCCCIAFDLSILAATGNFEKTPPIKSVSLFSVTCVNVGFTPAVANSSYLIAISVIFSTPPSAVSLVIICWGPDIKRLAPFNTNGPTA